MTFTLDTLNISKVQVVKGIWDSDRKNLGLRDSKEIADAVLDSIPAMVADLVEKKKRERMQAWVQDMYQKAFALLNESADAFERGESIECWDKANDLQNLLSTIMREV